VFDNEAMTVDIEVNW